MPELDWFKSSYSDNSNGHDCVEVATTPGTVHVRDSKDTSRPHLAFGAGAWTGFVPELDWFKSSYSSNANGNDCVEVASTRGAVHVRDSKDTSRPHLAFGQGAWNGFVEFAAGA